MATQFDSELRERLAAFQRAVGLSGDGIAGAATWQKLTETSAEPVVAEQVGDPNTEPASAPAEEPNGVAPVEASSAATPAEGTSGPAPAEEPAKVRAADYPALASVLALERTDEAVKEFLQESFGLDIDQLLQDMDALLPTAD